MIRLFLTEFNGEVTILNFLEWIANTENNTLKLLSQLFLGYGLGIYIQRIGDRNNDIEVVMLADINCLTYFSDLNTQFTEKWNIASCETKYYIPKLLKKC